MQFPESWLREFCNPPLSTEQLAETLTMGGLEVEELRPAAPPFTKIVVGEIKEAVQHPDADRLRVCKVDAGQGALLNIVCGAPNARAGIKVPCALVGAELPPGEDGKPFLIKLGKLRGVESQGMLCSARELKLSEDHAGLLELAADAPVGADVREVLKLDDTLFTLKLTPNLAHALSVYGVARELSALTGAPLKTPSFEPVKPAHDAMLEVRVAAPDLCGRFSGRIVRNVNTKAATPQWMVDRLARCGQRSVTALVDISNYVMFEFGRPSHIFDHDKIHGALEVRWGKPGEQLKLLNGNTVTVDEAVGVIADDREVESLAGIMGGDATAVSDDTRNVYVEAAFWWPQAIQGRSRRYNFSTDAGHRFERGVDPSQTVEHIEHITRLIIGICGGGSRADGRPGPEAARTEAGHAARGARVQGHRHAGHAGAVPGGAVPAATSRFRRRRHLDRHPAAVPLRPRHRGRPDRGGGAHHRLRQVAGHRAPRADHREAAARIAPKPLCRAQAAGGAGLPGNHQFQLRRGKLGARSGGQRAADPPAQPHRQPDGRDALLPAGLAAAGAQVQPGPQGRARARVRAGPGVPARWEGLHHRHDRARHPPTHAGRRPGLW